MSNHGERRWLGAGGADPHNDSTDDQHRRGGGQRADEGTSTKERNTDEHDLFASEIVTERTAGEHEGSERHGIGTDNPLEFRDRGMKP